MKKYYTVIVTLKQGGRVIGEVYTDEFEYMEMLADDLYTQLEELEYITIEGDGITIIPSANVAAIKLIEKGR